MLNWSGQAEITTRELVEAGLPQQGITLLNDMEAAAYALLAWSSGRISLDPDPVYTGPVEGNKGNNNAVLLIPGTGIGVSAVIDNNGGHPRGSPQVLACEMQHTPIPALDEKQETVLDDMKNIHAIKQPSWEDFISGRGLENIYQCLAPQPQGAGGSGLNAQDIAGYAVQGSDEYCVSALNMFYQCCGALAQLLALTFQPYAGIYLAGESTRRNLSFIRNSPFLQQLHHSDVRGYLLREFPVFLLAQELNLYGAAYAAGLNLQDFTS
jgi:glucokinase